MSEMSENTSSEKKERKNNPVLRSVVTLLLMVAISVSVSVFIVHYYDTHYATKIVTLDLKGYIKDQWQLFERGEISEDVLRARLDRLETIVNGTPKNEVILLGDVVLGNPQRKIEP